MRHRVPTSEEALAMAERVHEKFRPVWEGLPPAEQAALALYFLPHNSRKEILEPTRPRAIKWYCPFAHQRLFSSGHRYCVNSYTGCAHCCMYCYAAAYEPARPGIKEDFEKKVARDAEDLERFDVPPAPVHLSNSTDPFQPLEASSRHTRYALEQILVHRRRFTTVTVLTKNPLLPVELGYVELFKQLAMLPAGHPRREEFEQQGCPGFVLAASLAFWRDAARSVYDPGAPPVEERIAGLRALREAGIPLVLRIDPLFPRSPLPGCDGRTLGDFDLPEAQTLEDLENLVGLARELHVQHVVYSVAKIVLKRGRGLSPTMQAMRAVYRAMAAPQKLDWRGGSWRLPEPIARDHVLQPFLELCRKYDVVAKHCRQDLIQTP